MWGIESSVKLAFPMWRCRCDVYHRIKEFSCAWILILRFTRSFVRKFHLCPVLSYGLYCTVCCMSTWESRYILSGQSGWTGMECDSLFHPYAQGPKGENVGSITQPLPSNYLIFRAASESDGEAFFYFLLPLSNPYYTMRQSTAPVGAPSSFPSLLLLLLISNRDCLHRPLLDGCFGAGAQLLQSLQADSQGRPRGRHQHVVRVFPFPPPAAGQCAQRRRSLTVSIQHSWGPHKQTNSISIAHPLAVYHR